MTFKSLTAIYFKPFLGKTADRQWIIRNIEPRVTAYWLVPSLYQGIRYQSVLLKKKINTDTKAKIKEEMLYTQKEQ